jgi:hypothetical protein
MKNKRLKTLLIGLGIVVAILITSFSVLADYDDYDRHVNKFLYRGADRLAYGTDYKGTAGSFHCEISGVSFTGIPSGLFGSNIIVTRMRTEGGAYEASNSITFTSSLYQVSKWQTYKTELGYGGLGGTYELYATMSSSSANLSGYVTCWFSA